VRGQQDDQTTDEQDPIAGNSTAKEVGKHNERKTAKYKPQTTELGVCAFQCNAAK
jgi:hypothetical protein